MCKTNFTRFYCWPLKSSAFMARFFVFERIVWKAWHASLNRYPMKNAYAKMIMGRNFVNIVCAFVKHPFKVNLEDDKLVRYAKAPFVVIWILRSVINNIKEYYHSAN